jgi:isocitrate/isopropylmalate dehydrogenase
MAAKIPVTLIPGDGIGPEVTEATVKFAEAGNTSVAPLATAASAQDGAPVVSAAYAQTGAEPTEKKDETEGQPQQTSPELAAEPGSEEA